MFNEILRKLRMTERFAQDDKGEIADPDGELITTTSSTLRLPVGRQAKTPFCHCEARSNLYFLCFEPCLPAGRVRDDKRKLRNLKKIVIHIF